MKVWQSEKVSERGSLAVPLKFPFYKFLNAKIMTLQQNGLLHWLKAKHFVKPSKGCGSVLVQGKPLGFEKTLSLFLIMLSGLCMTVVSLAFERGLPKFWKQKPLSKLHDNSLAADKEFLSSFKYVENRLSEGAIYNWKTMSFHDLIQVLNKK